MSLGILAAAGIATFGLFQLTDIDNAAPEAQPAAVVESNDTDIIDNDIDIADSENKEEVAATAATTITIPQAPITATTTKSTPPSTPAQPAGPSIIRRLLPNENSEPRTKPITHVLVHFISNVSAKPQDPYNVDDIVGIFLSTGLSSHYLIARDGKIYQLTTENRVAYHGGKGQLPKFPEYTDKINHYSIGIEIAAIGTKEEMAEFIDADKYDELPKSDIGYTDAQYKSLNLLLDDIYERNPGIKKDRDHVIGHDEYAPGRKQDPGSLFDWSRIGF